jgi:hypothetical protein
MPILLQILRNLILWSASPCGFPNVVSSRGRDDPGAKCADLDCFVASLLAMTPERSKFSTKKPLPLE